MKCPKCNTDVRKEFNFYDDELICQTCGSAFELAYLGYYEEGSDDRIDEGFESDIRILELCDLKEKNKQ